MKAVPDEECRRLGGHGAASGVRGPDAGEKQRMSRRMGCPCLVSPGTETVLDVERHRQTVLSLQTSSAVGGAQWDQAVFHFGLWLGSARPNWSTWSFFPSTVPGLTFSLCSIINTSV